MTDPTRLSDGPVTESGKVMLEYVQEHFRGVHGTAHPELPEQFRSIEADARSLERGEIRAAVTRLRDVLGPLDPDQRQARADTLDAVLVMLEARAVR